MTGGGYAIGVLGRIGSAYCLRCHAGHPMFDRAQMRNF